MTLAGQNITDPALKYRESHLARGSIYEMKTNAGEGVAGLACGYILF
jgi:hypothetical protein